MLEGNFDGRLYEPALVKFGGYLHKGSQWSFVSAGLLGWKLSYLTSSVFRAGGRDSGFVHLVIEPEVEIRLE